jgi:hypothetical protein
VKQAARDNVPGVKLRDEPSHSGIPEVEAFLKMHRGETREEFSRRIGRWMGDSDPEVPKRVAMMIERTHVDRELALLAVSLAEYNLAHGEYPAALKDLGPGPSLQDSFSGKDIIYRRQGKGYLVYSFGLDMKDDQGEGDDIAVKTDK